MPQKRARSAGSASELENGLPISEGAAIAIKTSMTSAICFHKLSCAVNEAGDEATM